MEKYIQAMSDDWVKLLVCLLVLGTQVNAQTHNITITFVKNAVEKGAVCLDGSPAAYYHDKGVGKGAKNWIVNLDGGAWCTNDTECINRAKGYLGSSRKISQIDYNGFLFQDFKSPRKIENPDFYNWNRVHVVYCDGASFGGDVEEVDPKTNLHFRGARILPAVVEDLLAKGMKNAKNVILTGQSAGGLAVMLNCDRFRAQVPKNIKVKCFSDGGFFIRGKNLPGATKETIEQPFRNLVEYQGMAKILPKSCTSKMDAKLCLYPENFIRDIKTPLFMVNSAFDGYQVAVKVNVGPSGWGNCTTVANSCTADQLDLLKGFRKSFLKALPKGNCRSKGMFIDSYNLHIMWDYTVWSAPFSPKLKNKTRAAAFADWYFDRSCFQEIDKREKMLIFGQDNL